MHAARGMSICRWLALRLYLLAFPGPGSTCEKLRGPHEAARQPLRRPAAPFPGFLARLSPCSPGVEGACACESSQPRPIRPHHLPPSAQPGPPGLRGRAGSEKQPSWGSNGPPYPGVVQLPGACGIAVLPPTQEMGCSHTGGSQWPAGAGSGGQGAVAEPQWPAASERALSWLLPVTSSYQTTTR